MKTYREKKERKIGLPCDNDKQRFERPRKARISKDILHILEK
jgi:hypothetical protein